MTPVTAWTEFRFGRQDKPELFEIGAKRNSMHPAVATRWLTAEQTNILGVMGEFAAGQCLGVGIDKTYSERGDGGIDLKLQDKSIAAVKFNHRARNPMFICNWREGDELGVRAYEVHKAHYCILVHGYCDPPEVCNCLKTHLNPGQSSTMIVLGYITIAEFYEHSELRKWEEGTRHIVEPHHFHPLVELLALTN